MYEIRFIFWESMKVLSLLFLALLSARAVNTFASQQRGGETKRPVLLKLGMYSVILGLVAIGARTLGYNLAAEVYRWTSERNLQQSELTKAYENALHAVELRPDSAANWRTLSLAKIAKRQFESALDDLLPFQTLWGGNLDEEDAYRFAACYFYLGQYDKLVLATERLIERNRMYAAPYVLQGLAYTALGKHAEAEGSFLAILQIFPNNQSAVEGLAHEYFLAGKRERALAVLNQTAQYRFPPDAVARFESLKRLYAQ